MLEAEDLTLALKVAAHLVRNAAETILQQRELTKDRPELK
jgi:hypothetical protein